MKKRGVIPALLMGAALGVGLGIGIAAMIDRLPEMSKGASIGLLFAAVVALYGFFLLEMSLHEAGHLLFGLLTGWRFVSFRIGNVIWLRGKDGRIQRKKFALAGTGGQCLMAPPPWREEGFPCELYNLGGVIMNLGTALMCGLLAWALWETPVAAMLLIEAALIGLILALTNGLPMPGLVVTNDGSNALNIRRDRNARRALWVQMSVAAAQAEGTPLREMPEDWFAPFPEEAMDNPLVGAVAVMAENRLTDALDLAGAEQAVRALLQRKTGVLPLYRVLLTLDGASFELLAGRPADLTQALDQPQVQQVMKAMKTNPTVLRARYIHALLLDHDAGAAEEMLAAFEKTAATYPYPQDLVAERALMAQAREKAEQHG